MLKKLLMLAAITASIGVTAPAASASCSENPTDLGPQCMETIVCNAASAVLKNVDCIE